MVQHWPSINTKTGCSIGAYKGIKLNKIQQKCSTTCGSSVAKIEFKSGVRCFATKYETKRANSSLPNTCPRSCSHTHAFQHFMAVGSVNMYYPSLRERHVKWRALCSASGPYRIPRHGCTAPGPEGRRDRSYSKLHNTFGGKHTWTHFIHQG